MQNTLIVLLICVALMIGGLFLEGYLAKKESKWPGLVLPILCGLLSLLYPLNIIAINQFSGQVEWGGVIAMGMAFLLANIPTVILLAIYGACRGKERQKRQMDKMNIQDLG